MLFQLSVEPCSSRLVGAGLIPRVVMALGGEVNNDNATKQSSQKVKKCPVTSNLTEKSGSENGNKGKVSIYHALSYVTLSM